MRPVLSVLWLGFLIGMSEHAGHLSNLSLHKGEETCSRSFKVRDPGLLTTALCPPFLGYTSWANGLGVQCGEPQAFPFGSGGAPSTS